MARVSVIIPAYNPGPHLRTAIQSVIDQSFTDWELIVIDDGSTEELTALQSEFPSMKYLRVPRSGVSKARNRGILETTAAYVAFLDSDDVWHKTKLAQQVDFMDRNADVALCHTGVEYIDADGAQTGSQQGLELIDSYVSLLQGPCLVTSSVLMRRNLLLEVGMFNPLFSGAEDYELFLKVAHGYKIAPIPLPLMSYRKLRGSLSSNYKHMHLELRLIYKQHLLACGQGKKSQETREAVKIGYQAFRGHLGRAAFDQCRIAVQEGNTVMFLTHLLESLKYNPGFTLQSILLWFRLKVAPVRH